MDVALHVVSRRLVDFDARRTELATAASIPSTRKPIVRDVSPASRGSATAKWEPSGSSNTSASTPPT